MDDQTEHNPLDETLDYIGTLSGGMTLVPGYGCYVNLDDIVKIDVSSNGVVHSVIAWLRSEVGAAGKANSFAVLTRGFDEEQEAQRACNEIVSGLAYQGLLSVGAVGDRTKATWPTPL